MITTFQAKTQTLRNDGAACPGGYLIGLFTVVCLVTWPWIESEAGGDLVLIQTSLFFICKCN